MILENGTVRKNEDGLTFLEFKASENENLFQLLIKPNEPVTHGQPIAYLIENNYKTETGGIIYYSTSYGGKKQKKNSKTLFNGFLYWVPEEAHQLTMLSLENLRVKSGDYIKKGTCLFQNVMSNLNGLVQINEEKTELTIKSGELYQITKNMKITADKCNQFIKTGETLFLSVIAQKLSYIEFLKFNETKYILIRTVISYAIAKDKGFFFSYRFSINLTKRSFALTNVIRCFYGDGEKVKSSVGIHLLQTFLVLSIKNKYPKLHSKLEYLSLNSSFSELEYFKLKLTLYERIKIKSHELSI